MRLSLLALLITLSPLIARDATPTGEELLDNAIARPGAWNQMCMLPPPVKSTVPLPLYGLSVARHFNLSGKTAATLLAHRADVVAALVRRFETMDVTRSAVPKKKPVEGQKPEFPPASDLDPKLLSGVLLEVVLRLNAVEALPAMMKVEAQLAALIEVAENDASAPVPDLPVDGIWYPEELSTRERTKGDKIIPKPDANVILRRQALLRCRVYQREMLSVMVKLLRDANFQPLFDSAIERPYGDALKKAAQSDELKHIKKPADIPEKERTWIRWDSHYNLPVTSFHRVAELPFTPEVRTQIRGFVEQFVKEQPTNK